MRLAFWAALAFAVMMALLPQPPRVPGNPPDKVLHIVAFAVLAGLATAAYPRARLYWQGLALTGLGAAIEFAQMIPALNRDAQFSDWIADTAAVVIVLAIACVGKHWLALGSDSRPPG